jgi:exo-beta-1,3-glucanase (GH17 family)
VNEQKSKLPIPYQRAICYSGFREGQRPGYRYPSYEEILEDLLILQGHWNYLRLYDCDPHSETVLQVIRNEQLDFKVMLGAYIVAERNNHACPWGGGTYSEKQLELNIAFNNKRIQKLIALANQYPIIINALSVGNEACVDWTDHYVPVDRVIEFVQLTQSKTNQPVTFCENYVPWLNKLKPLGEIVDFISIHTYPVWEYKNIHEALNYTKDNYNMVANTYPDKKTIITEAGWATNSNGRGIDPNNVSQELQQIYFNDLMQWTDEDEIITYVFEAFDEPWKGSPEPLEPEKHWGLFDVNRKPKMVTQEMINGIKKAK